METLTGHTIAWGIYLLAFLGLYWCWARLVYYIPTRLARQLLKGALVVLFLVPVASSQLDGWWAPAWLHALYSHLLGQPEEVARALVNFAWGGAAVLVIILLDVFVIRRR